MLSNGEAENIVYLGKKSLSRIILYTIAVSCYICSSRNVARHEWTHSMLSGMYRQIIEK